MYENRRETVIEFKRFRLSKMPYYDEEEGTGWSRRSLAQQYSQLMKRAISIREALQRQLCLIEASNLRLHGSWTLLDESEKILRSAKEALRAPLKGRTSTCSLVVLDRPTQS
jgi:hypothetical protein